MTGKIYYTLILCSITLIYPFCNPFGSYDAGTPPLIFRGIGV